MKVAQILYSGLGGHGSVAFSLIEGDKKRLWEHYLLFYGVEDLKTDYERFCREKSIPFLFVKKTQRLDFKAVKKINSFIKENKIDYVILHSVTLAPFLLLYPSNRHKIIMVEHTPNQSKKKSEWISSFIGNMFFKTIFLSALYRQEIRSKYNFFFRKNKTTIIPNGIDTGFFTPTKRCTGDKMTISMVARFSYSKQQNRLISAIKHLREMHISVSYRLILAGDGDCLKDAKKLAKNLCVSDLIEFPGLLSEKEVCSLLKETDIYCHISSSETMSTSIMQAMSCGLPIIASDIPGINNMLIHDKTGLLIHSPEPGTLADQIKNLMFDQFKRSLLATNARQYAVANFANELMFQRYHNFLLE